MPSLEEVFRCIDSVGDDAGFTVNVRRLRAALTALYADAQPAWYKLREWLDDQPNPIDTADVLMQMDAINQRGNGCH